MLEPPREQWQNYEIENWFFSKFMVLVGCCRFGLRELGVWLANQEAQRLSTKT
jgi:hypothetical protein